MTRKEQIKQAEVKYSNNTMFDGCDYVGQAAKEYAFIAGAKWADKNPKKGMVSIEKACEWWSEWFDTHNPYNMENCIDDFRKAMKEE